MADQENCKYAAKVHEFASMEIFATDIEVDENATELTKEEIAARSQWNKTHEGFSEQYNSANEPLLRINDVLELMMATIVPPPLSESPSARSCNTETHHYKYPPCLEAWDDFAGAVDGFQPENIDLVGKGIISLLGCSVSSILSQACDGKKSEHIFLQGALWNSLANAGFMQLEEDFANPSVIGLPDEISFSDGKPSAVIEVKSSHNLLIPNDFKNIKQKYDEGPLRNKCWLHIGHPVAQILAYMMDNNCRYGALCSASKTYFIFCNTDGTCQMTSAWLTCHKHFVKAWAYFLHHASKQPFPDDLKIPENWLKNTPRKEETNNDNVSGDNNISSHNKDGQTGSYSADNQSGAKRKRIRPKESKPCNGDYFDFESGFVSLVPLHQVAFGEPIGHGRNGAVFQAQFGERLVAVKQFDLSKQFDSYRSEVLAYKHLQTAWGIHIPKPLFVAESKSGMVRFLGMEKGRMPAEDDFEREFNRFLKKVTLLKRAYGFEHLDVWNNGGNFVLDEKGNVLVIDLEMWEKV